MERQNYSTGTPWEAIAGYSRAVRVGAMVFVSGTTATDTEGTIHHPNDAYGQAVYIYQKIAASLQAVQSSLRDVVRTRVYITRSEDVQAVIKAHHEFFESIRPANTLVVVAALAAPEMLVEIEVDAVIADSL